jgi:excisionase family DNA binding protein
MQPSTLPFPQLRVVPAPLLTVKEVAARLKTSRATIYRLCEIGQLRHARVSTHALRIAADALADFIARTGATAT